MTRNTPRNPLIDPEQFDVQPPRQFVDASWRIELPKLAEPLMISERLNELLFSEAKHQDAFEVFEDPEYPCLEVARRFAESALVLATAFAAAERSYPVSVEIPVIEGVTSEKTRVKVFRFRDEPARDGFLILLDDEPDPTALELAELEADAFSFGPFDEWDDV